LSVRCGLLDVSQTYSPPRTPTRIIVLYTTQRLLGLDSFIEFLKPIYIYDRLCGLVVRVLGYRSGGPGSIPGTTRKKVVGLERGPLSIVSTTEELLARKSRGSGIENQDYSRRGFITLTTWLYPQKLILTSLTGGVSLVGIIRSRIQATEFSFSFLPSVR
jgi:hypothetical protein